MANEQEKNSQTLKSVLDMEKYVAEQRRSVADLRSIYKSGMMGTDLAQSIVGLDEIVRNNNSKANEDLKMADSKLIKTAEDLKE